MWGSGPVPEELSGFPGYLLARLGEASRRRFAQALAPEELHPRQFGAMTIIAAHPGLNQQELHKRSAIDASSMVTVIDELEGKGLAERRADPGDRRARAVFLTPAGEQKLERARALAGRLQGELFGGLTAQERDTLLRLLRKLAAAQF
jgi:DNA-binding MarR family transcriptional regulator